jgi:uncharacterized membrane protein YvlD (DUF360 family)
MVFENGLNTFLLTGFALTIGSLIAKPIINLMLLPLNLITFGLFRWVSSAVILYLITMVVKSFKIAGFYFAGYNSVWIDIPEISFKGILAFISFSFMLSVIISFIHWLMK